MIPKKDENSNIILQEEKFTKHKLMTNDLILKLRDVNYVKYSEMVLGCGSYLKFSHQEHIETKDTRERLKDADFCKFRFCPMCSWRRNININRELLVALSQIERYKRVSYLFLTLTVRNPSTEDLKATVKQMNQSFKRMSETKAYKKSIIGHFKALEIVGDKTLDGEVHPHFHILMIVNSSYFTSRYYLSQARWTEMWKKALRVEYTPVVDIRKVKAKNNQLSALQSAIYETVKYSVKHTELTSKSDEDFRNIIEQTHRMRFFSTGGILKRAINFVKCDDDLINLNEEQEASWVEIGEFLYKWEAGNYLLSEL